MIKRRSNGYVLLSAIFVLLVCAIMASVLVRQIQNDAAMSVLHYQSTQAYLSARSALEQSGVNQLRNCRAEDNLRVLVLAGLACRIKVLDAQCAEGAALNDVYEASSIARCSGEGLMIVREARHP